MASAERVREGELWELFDVAGHAESGGAETYLERVLRRCAEWFRASGASIFVGQEGDAEFHIAAATGTLSQIPNDASVRPGVGIAGAALERRVPLLVQDPSSDPELAGRRLKRRRDVGSAMVLPLIASSGESIGVINFSRKTNAKPFGEGDLAQASALARLIALAVSNARLFVRTNVMMHESVALHETLRSVIESVGFGLLVVSQFGSFLKCNPEAQAMLGGAPDPERYWEEFVDSVPDAFRQPLRSAIAEALEGRSTNQRVSDPVTGRAFALISSPLSSRGATVAIHDITEHERIRAEEARLKRLAEIGQMTAGIAHDIRNPLTGIRSAAQMVQQGPEYAQEFGRIIEDEAMKLNALCDEFLELSKPLLLNLAPTALGRVVSDACERCRQDFEAKRVALLVQIGLEQPIIQADARRIDQALRNLLRNALQATMPGRAVRVRVEGAELTIEDEGCGMNADTVEKLFSPFFTTKASGTGLGLCNVRRIVDAHGADIKVWSELEMGTRFEIRFPNEDPK